MDEKDPSPKSYLLLFDTCQRPQKYGDLDQRLDDRDVHLMCTWRDTECVDPRIVFPSLNYQQAWPWITSFTFQNRLKGVVTIAHW